jgi:hypothetical protein
MPAALPWMTSRGDERNIRHFCGQFGPLMSCLAVRDRSWEWAAPKARLASSHPSDMVNRRVLLDQRKVGDESERGVVHCAFSKARTSVFAPSGVNHGCPNRLIGGAAARYPALCCQLGAVEHSRRYFTPLQCARQFQPTEPTAPGDAQASKWLDYPRHPGQSRHGRRRHGWRVRRRQISVHRCAGAECARAFVCGCLSAQA